MISNILIFLIGCLIGASLMKLAVNYKDKHLIREMAKTEHYRGLNEQARVLLAQYQGAAKNAVATPNNELEDAPAPLDLFTAEDQIAINNGMRVVRMRRGGAK